MAGPVMGDMRCVRGVLRVRVPPGAGQLLPRPDAWAQMPSPDARMRILARAGADLRHALPQRRGGGCGDGPVGRGGGHQVVCRGAGRSVGVSATGFSWRPGAGSHLVRRLSRPADASQDMARRLPGAPLVVVEDSADIMVAERDN